MQRNENISLCKSSRRFLWKKQSLWLKEVNHSINELILKGKKVTFRFKMNCGTMFSLTKATAHPPHPAPVSLAPSAPLCLQILTSSSSSGQLFSNTNIKLFLPSINTHYFVCYSIIHHSIYMYVYLHSKRTLQLWWLSFIRSPSFFSFSSSLQNS